MTARPVIGSVVLGSLLTLACTGVPDVADLRGEDLTDLDDLAPLLQCDQYVQSFAHRPVGTAESAVSHANSAMGDTRVVDAEEAGNLWLLADEAGKVIGGVSKVPGTVLYCENGR